MIIRTARAEWQGDLQNGKGNIEFGNERLRLSYSAASRFGDGKETNPEELIAAAHAACFSMALSNVLSKAGLKVERIRTRADVALEKIKDGYALTKIVLKTEVAAPDLENETFQGYAADAKKNCPVSKALAGCEIRLEARLV